MFQYRYRNEYTCMIYHTGIAIPAATCMDHVKYSRVHDVYRYVHVYLRVHVYVHVYSEYGKFSFPWFCSCTGYTYVYLLE